MSRRADRKVNGGDWLLIQERNIEITLAAKNIKHFERLGYGIPRHPNSTGGGRVKQGSKIVVRVVDLLPGSTVKVTKVCDYCGDVVKGQEYSNVLRRRKDGKDRCNSCAIKSRSVERAEAGESVFHVRPDLITLWDTSKNSRLDMTKQLPGSTSKAWWLCSCGWSWTAVIGDVVRGSGCPACAMSQGEHIVMNYLRERGEKFIAQYSVPELVGRRGRRLSFDFAVTDPAGSVILIIEVDGDQHSSPVNFLGEDPVEATSKFVRQRSYDRMKDDWARSQGIKMLRIAYSRAHGFHEESSKLIRDALDTIRREGGKSHDESGTPRRTSAPAHARERDGPASLGRGLYGGSPFD